jgi:hypothetical protein
MMSLLERLNKLLEPVKRAVKAGPLGDLLVFDSVLVSYTEPQSGLSKTCSTGYIRDETVVYLIFNKNDSRWKNLAKGIPVKILIDGKNFMGWAEDLTGYEEFVQVLSKNPEKLEEIGRRYNLADLGILEVEKIKPFLQDNKLIRVKISR